MELKTLFGGIADAIREQDGTAEEIVAKDFPARIRAIPAGCNSNILMNWYFAEPVNRQGESEYSAGDMDTKTIDRWYITRGMDGLKVEDGYIEISTMTADAAFYQLPVMEDGKTYTLSALVQGVNNPAGVQAYTNGAYNTPALVPPSDDFVLAKMTFVYKIAGSEYANVRICGNEAGSIIRAKAAKLELGSAQTLAHQDAEGNWVLNDPADYAGEYAKCAQYDPVTGDWIGFMPITARSSDPAGGTVSGGGLASNGMTVTVKAEPKEGYRFAGWYENETPRLPTGYTEVEYIQSSGTQYIDTGFTPNQDTRVVVQVKFGSPMGQAPSYALFGSRERQNLRAFTIFSYESRYFTNYGSTQGYTAQIGSIDGPFVIDKNKNVTSINGTVLTNSAETFECPGSMYLFAINSNNSIFHASTVTLYYCKIYDNGILIRDYMPCKNSSGAVGLYDLMEGTFYANAGAGAFEAGPEINPLVSTDAEYAFAVSGARDLVGVFEEEQGN